METSLTGTVTTAQSKGLLWAGRIISGLVILFLLFDSVSKIAKESHSVSGTMHLGFTENAVQPIGITLLICTILYIIPRTSIIGAVLITGYLGGALAIMIRADQPAYFPVVFGVLVWLALYLRNEKVRNILS
jgi:hypothetical protein